MNYVLRPATSTHSLLIGLKKAGLLTNRFYKPFDQLSCPHLCSFNPISFLLVVVLLFLIDIGPCILLQPQQTVAQFNQICEMSTRLTPKVCRHSHAEEIQIEFSSHFTSLPYEIVRTTSDVVISYPLSPPPVINVLQPSHRVMIVYV